MKRINLVLLLLLIACLTAGACSPQSNKNDRQPAVAGQFYPASKAELRSTLEDLFAKALPSKNFRNVVAIIAPHAGYVYSGVVAASSFNQIDPAKEYENIFVLGPSHHVGFEGASIYTEGNFITPLGTVKVNTELGKQLVSKYPFFSSRTDAHAAEHSVEVQIPFLQFRMKKSFQIVPIVVGIPDPEMMRKIAGALRPYLTPKNLFVISTDFSHYPSYEDANKVDKITADAVLSNSPENLIKTYTSNDISGISGLVTSMCGYADVLTLLYMTENNPNFSYNLIQYRNAGDSEVGDKSRVVGYCAITVSLKERKKEEAGFNLNAKDRKELLSIARRTIEQNVAKHTVPDLDTANLSPGLKTNSGAFVTINKNGNLRGCIGRFDATEPLYKVVQQMAVAASTEDYRFPPVDESELRQLEIEISVLTPMRKISSIDEIQMGKNGIYIKKGMRSGTFLPQVAKETGWSKEEFLGHCAQDKAGIGWDGWKDADIYVYEAYVFGESQ
ncbi:MAG: AmmeMemoRadiSam system protein B [Bacteroidota bacterium]|jgi:AmmeMemoRadiSam system protein B/AmmeMemoRadiSam system protein A